MKKAINLRSTNPALNPMIPAPKYRPICSARNCKNTVAIISAKKDGSPYYRKVCQLHHQKSIIAKNGVDSILELTAKNAGYKTITGYLNAQAKKAGFKNLTERRNSTHRYLKYRKDYCENVDGRLGHKCTTTIFWEGMLDVDHKNGKPDDNRPRNLQTLCKCCHSYKTNLKKDYKTPGRKSLGIK